MSKNINIVTLAGRTTKDPELKLSQGGSTILSFSLAVNDIKKNAQGAWEDVGNFFDCVMFGERAEHIAQYITKGSKLTINGRLHQDRWQAQDGTNRSRVSIIVQDIELPPKSQPQPQESTATAYAAQPQPVQPTIPTQSNRLINVQTTAAASQVASQPVSQDSMYGDEIPF